MDQQQIVWMFAALLSAAFIALCTTPLVRVLAFKVGAVDVPKDNRRMHKKPIPRLGGLAIFFGFLFSVLLFGDLTTEVRGMLIGALVIVTLGVVDDILALNAWIKLIVQIVAAAIPVLAGVRIERISNFCGGYIDFGVFAIPITIIWIVALTNAVNFIDGLDGLAAGVSAISSLSLLLVSIIRGDVFIALLSAALAGSCLGFLPYNLNPAKIFMGDTGSEFLGFVLAVLSVQGLFKFYALVSFAVPFLILGLPILDLTAAVIRRIAHGKSPFAADRGHLHHKLIDSGLSQKQAVAIIYAISTVFGIAAVVLTEGDWMRALILLAAALVILLVSFKIYSNENTRSLTGLTSEMPAAGKPKKTEEPEKEANKKEQKPDDQDKGDENG